MLRKAYFDGPFGQTHYVSESSGEPIVLVHQMVQSSRQFYPAMPILATRGLRPIAVDLPGFGMSDEPEEPPGAAGYASVIPALLDHLELDNAILCGHHTGATVVTACADSFPDRVTKLILHGTPYYDKAQAEARLNRPKKAHDIEPDGSHFKAFWDRLIELSSGKASLEATNLSVLLYFMAGEKEWYGHHAAFSFDMEQALRSLKIPVGVVSNRGDMIHECDKRVIELRPDFEYREMAETGTYQVVYDQPAVWANLVADLIDCL